MNTMFSRQAAGPVDLTPEDGPFGGQRKTPYMQIMHFVVNTHDEYQAYKQREGATAEFAPEGTRKRA